MGMRASTYRGQLTSSALAEKTLQENRDSPSEHRGKLYSYGFPKVLDHALTKTHLVRVELAFDRMCRRTVGAGKIDTKNLFASVDKDMGSVTCVGEEEVFGLRNARGEGTGTVSGTCLWGRRGRRGRGSKVEALQNKGSEQRQASAKGGPENPKSGTMSREQLVGGACAVSTANSDGLAGKKGVRAQGRGAERGRAKGGFLGRGILGPRSAQDTPPHLFRAWRLRWNCPIPRTLKATNKLQWEDSRAKAGTQKRVESFYPDTKAAIPRFHFSLSCTYPYRLATTPQKTSQSLPHPGVSGPLPRIGRGHCIGCARAKTLRSGTFELCGWAGASRHTGPKLPAVDVV